MFALTAKLESSTSARPATRFIGDMIRVSLASWNFHVNYLGLLNDRLCRTFDHFQVKDMTQIYDSMSEWHRFVFESKLCVANRIWRIYNFSAICCESELIIREQIRFFEAGCYLYFRGNQWHTVKHNFSYKTIVP